MTSDKSQRSVAGKLDGSEKGDKPATGSLKSDGRRLAADDPEKIINKSETPIKSDPDSYWDEHPTSEITMEVHHHPDLNHKKKAWREYFLEFLMIFLAVTMGFFAETMRENISENGKAKELAKSLYLEAYNDSVIMQSKIALRRRKEVQMEYFRMYVKDSSLTHLSERFYPSFMWSYIITAAIEFEPNDGILNQLRNSGTLRYFKSTELQNAISRINTAIFNVRNRNNQEYAYNEQYVRPFLLKHYDFGWEDEYTQNGKLSTLNALSQISFHPKITPQIRDISDFKRDEADALIAYYLVILRSTKQLHYNTYVKANHQLLQALRVAYHIEND
ncbi:MAG TPA: hypothetical protein VGI43_19450 [Mucilaginibacter sp.]